MSEQESSAITCTRFPELELLRRRWKVRQAAAKLESAGFSFGGADGHDGVELRECDHESGRTRTEDGVCISREPIAPVSSGSIGTWLMRNYYRGLRSPISRAAIAFMFNSVDGVIAEASSAIEADGNNGEAYLRLFYAYLRKGDDGSAFEHLAIAAQIMPEVAKWLE